MWISITRSKTHVGMPTLAKTHLTISVDIFMQQQSGCGYGSVLQGPRHLLRSIVGYGNVTVNRQQHSYNYLEGDKEWSVSGIVHLLHCQPHALVKYQEILMHVKLLLRPNPEEGGYDVTS